MGVIGMIFWFALGALVGGVAMFYVCFFVWMMQFDDPEKLDDRRG